MKSTLHGFEYNTL